MDARGSLSLRSRLVQLALITLAVSMALYTRWLFSPVQETMRTALSLSDGTMALLQGVAPAAGQILAAVPLGMMIDRYSRSRALFIFSCLLVVGSFGTAFSSTVLALFASRFLIGAANVGVLIASFSLMADIFAPSQRGRATIALSTGPDFANSAAFAFAGVLLVWFLPDPMAWRYTIIVMTAPVVAAAIMLLWLVDPPRAVSEMGSRPFKAVARELWGLRRLGLPLIAARAMVGVADGATLAWAAPLFSRKFSLSPAETGAIVGAIVLFTGLLSGPLGGGLADYCHKRGGTRATVRSMGILALASIPFGFFGLASGHIVTALMLAAFLGLGMTANVAGAAVATIVLPGHLRGTFVAITMFSGAIFGYALAPVFVSSLTTYAFGSSGVGIALSIVGISATIVAATVFLWGSRYLPGRDERS